jgi:hypothetical protein
MSSNNSFFKSLCNSKKVLNLMIAILTESLNCFETSGNLGNLRFNIFVLHFLSSNTDYCIRLNTPCEESIYNYFSYYFPTFTTGCYADLLLLFISKLILSPSTPQLKKEIHALQESLVSILLNIAPYIIKFNINSAEKYFELFAFYSDPIFLFSMDKNYINLHLLLSSLEAIAQNHFRYNLLK